MKKLVERDKKVRKAFKKLEKKIFVLRAIQRNKNLPILTRWHASNNLNHMKMKTSKALIINHCVLTINKKKFGKWTHYSRIPFLKLAKAKKIYGLTESSW